MLVPWRVNVFLKGTSVVEGRLQVDRSDGMKKSSHWAEDWNLPTPSDRGVFLVKHFFFWEDICKEFPCADCLGKMAFFSRFFLDVQGWCGISQWKRPVAKNSCFKIHQPRSEKGTSLQFRRCLRRWSGVNSAPWGGFFHWFSCSFASILVKVKTCKHFF